MGTGLKTCFYAALAGAAIACFAGPAGETPQQLPSPVPLPEAPAVRAVYETQRCAACHGAQAEGGPGAPALRGSGLDPLAFELAVRRGSPTMPAYDQAVLPATAVEALQGWLVGSRPTNEGGPEGVAETVRRAISRTVRAQATGAEPDLVEAFRLARLAGEQARQVAGAGVSPPAQGALEALAETASLLPETSAEAAAARSLAEVLDEQLWPLALDAVLRGGQPGGIGGVVLGGEGRPLAGALVLAEAGRGFAARSTDVGGRFRLRDLPAVAGVSLWALHPQQGCLRQRITVPAGAALDGLVLRLPGSHSIAVPTVRDAAVRRAGDASSPTLYLEASLAPEAAPPSHVWAAAPALGTAVRLRPEGGSRYAATYRPPPEPRGRIEWQFWAVVPGCAGARRILDFGF